MGSGLEVRLTESRDELPLNRAQWNALAEQGTSNTVFQTFEWFDAWWTAFGSNHRLFLLTVHRADAVVAVAPLMLTRGPLGLNVLEFTGTPNSDYQDLLVSADCGAACDAIIDRLVAERRRWQMVVLRNLPSGSPTIAALDAACARQGLRVTNLERQPCPAFTIRGHQDEVRRLSDRYSVRRAIKKLAVRGAVQFRKLDSIEAIDRQLPVFFEQHARRWAGSRAPSPFSQQPYCDWYRALAHAAHEAGWLHFSVLECGGVPAAFHFGFSYAGVLSWYKPSFSPDFARESPGTTLIQSLIEDASTHGLLELDFAGGMEPFKIRFSNVQRECLNLRIFPRGLLGTAFIAGARMRAALGRALKPSRSREPAEPTREF